jgi:hypothetical protein
MVQNLVLTTGIWVQVKKVNCAILCLFNILINYKKHEYSMFVVSSCFELQVNKTTPIPSYMLKINPFRLNEWQKHEHISVLCS